MLQILLLLLGTLSGNRQTCLAFQPYPTIGRVKHFSSDYIHTEKRSHEELIPCSCFLRMPLRMSVDIEEKEFEVIVTKERRILLEQQTSSVEVQGDEMEGNRTIIFLLWIVAILSALDRVAMSVAIVPMASEFGYGDTIKGSISSFFSVGYGLLIIPSGLVLSKLSPKKILAVGLCSWSLATIATPVMAKEVTDTLTPLLVVRACVGAAESVVIPSMQRLLAAWTTAEQKSLAIATIFSGFHLGTIFAYFLSPYVIDSFGGWRSLFYVYGGLGLLTVIPWVIFSRDSPKDVSRTTIKHFRLPSTSIDLDQVKKTISEVPLKGFAQSKGVWAMLIAHAAKNVGLYISLSWTPTFYAEQYGIGVKDSALLSVLPSVAGAVGGLVAGTFADTVIRKLEPGDVESVTKVRKFFQGIGLYGPAIALGTLALNIPEDAWVAQLFLTAAVGLQAFNAAGYEAGNQEKAGERWAGLLYSITSLPAVMLGTGAVYLTGEILETTGQNWAYVFGLNALINIVGATGFIILYDSKREFE